MNLDAARARRLMGVATALALVTVTVLTHWPGLGLGTPSDPGPDKTMHMLAAALLTAGAWFSGWFRTLPRLFVVALAWAALDEWTQGFAWIRRVPDVEDWVADAMGIVIALAWIRATRPLGGWNPRQRRAERDRSLAEIFARVWAWPLPVFAAALGGAAAYPVFAFVGARSWAMPSLQVTMTGVAVLAIASGMAGVEIMVRLLRPSRRPALSDRMVLRIMVGPALAAFAALIAVTAAAQLLMVLRPILAPASILDEWYRMRSQTLRAAIDFAIILLLAAWACGRTRRNIAARLDRAHRECIRCDHDLTGLEPGLAESRCPECGLTFEYPPMSGAIDQRAAET